MTYLIEEWKPVVGFEGRYEVSRRGSIRRGTKILKPQLNHAGYLKVTLYMDGIGKRLFVHVVVARAFHGPCPLGYEVNHIDTVRSNAKAANLEYLTPSANRIYTVRLGRMVSQKLTVADVIEMKRLASEIGCRRLGRMFDVSFQTVRRILRGERWTHVA